MRVALVTERFLPHLGGVEFHVEALASGLGQRGHDVEILTAEPKLPEGCISNQAYRIRNFRSLRFLQGTRLPIGLVRAPTSAYDVVHIHNYHSLALAVLGSVQGPAVLTPHFHGAGRTVLLNALHTVYRHVAVRWLRKATAVICVSNHEARRFRARFPDLADRVIVIPNPLRVAFTPTPVPADSKSLLGIGRLERYKRFDLSILALRDMPGWHLTLIGDGPERHHLEALARNQGVDNRVTFAGSVNDQAVGDYLRHATCLLQLSTLEAFGMTTLEAVAAGRPVVVAAGGAPAELGKAFPGWVHESPSLNLADIVAAIERAYSSAPAAAPDLRPFDPDRFVESTLQIYQGVISSAGHQRRG